MSEVSVAADPLVRRFQRRLARGTEHRGQVGAYRARTCWQGWSSAYELRIASRSARLPSGGRFSFLDELAASGKHFLVVLRQPLEVGVVTISRAQGTLSFPARFVMVGAMNSWH